MKYNITMADINKLNEISTSNMNKLLGISISNLKYAIEYSFVTSVPCDPNLNYILVDYSANECDTDQGTHIWTSGSTLANAYSADYKIFEDCSGVTYKETGYYYVYGTRSPYYQWDNGELIWIGSSSCVTSFSSSDKNVGCTEACLDSIDQTYYHDGGNIVPSVGDKVYSDSSGSNLLIDGYYIFNDLVNKCYNISSGVIIGTIITCS